MNWLDVVLICLISGMVAIGLRRGLARSAFDAFTVLLAGGLGFRMGHTLSQSMKFSIDPHTNEAYCCAIMFVILAAALVGASVKLFGSSEYFDSGISGLCGFVTGILLCSVIVRAIAMTSDPSSLPDAIDLSLFGKQFITFSWYHHIMDVLMHFNGN